jgi:hypothetical protein
MNNGMCCAQPTRLAYGIGITTLAAVVAIYRTRIWEANVLLPIKG